MTAARADFINDPPPPGDCRRADRPGEPLTNGITVQPAPDAGVTDLTEARRRIDEAKQLLMQRSNLTEPEAHRWIQKTAMDRRAPKLAIAIGIIEALSETS